jgi:hypothetical protein
LRAPKAPVRDAAAGSAPVARGTVDGTVVAAGQLKELREPLRLVGAEAYDSTWLPPWLSQRVAHISDDRLGRRLPYALECSPTLPGRFQARGRALRTGDQLWITHRAIPPKSYVPRL